MIKARLSVLLISVFVVFCSFGVHIAACAEERAIQVTKQAYVLDVGGISDRREIYLLMALQGIVNRDAPRLFIISHGTYPPAEHIQLKYLESIKNFHFTRLNSLGEAIQTFTRMGLLKGLVQYEIPKRGWDWDKYGYHGNIALTIAGQRSLLPVTSKILALSTPLLAGDGCWGVDDMKHGHWSAVFVEMKPGTNGLTIKPLEKAQAKAARYGCYAHRWVELDLNVASKFEITVSRATGPWTVILEMGEADDEECGGVRLFKDVKEPGVFVFDLKDGKQSKPSAGRADIRICPLGANSEVTVSSIRILDASGQVATVAPLRQNWFEGLAVAEDLRGKIADNEADACRWALETLMPQCSKKTAFHAQPWWGNLKSMDYAVARAAFIFYQDKDFYRDSYPFFDDVMSCLEPQAEVLGWGGSETYWIHKLSYLGKREITAGAANLSFWRQVPLDGPLSHPRKRFVEGPVQPKCYVNFLISSGDAISIISDLYNGCWEDKSRGKVPVTWGSNPNLVNMAPALLEYFAVNATPVDSFCAGPSGSGYNNPVVMMQSGFCQGFAESTRRDLQKAGMNMAVDYWDMLADSPVDAVNRLFTRPGKYDPVRMLIPNPAGMSPARNRWMDDGTPMVLAERGGANDLWCLYKGSKINWADPAGDIAERIMKVAETNEMPFFISANVRLPVSILKGVMDRLPKDKYEVVGMPDFERLAREAGCFTVEAVNHAVSAGDGAAVMIELRNTDGLRTKPGRITWTLPSGWTASEKSWDYGKVPVGGIVRHVVKFTPPACTSAVPAELEFKDSNVSYTRRAELTCYPETRLICACDSTNNWTFADGAHAIAENGIVKLLPVKPITSETFFTDIQNGQKLKLVSGRAFHPLGQVDFSRAPFLEIDVDEIFGGGFGLGLRSGTQSKEYYGAGRLQGKRTVNFAFAGWVGVKDVSFWIDPMRGWGHYLKIRRITLCYAK